MQYSLSLAPFNRLAGVHKCLLAAFGSPRDCLRLGPVNQMVLAILSARTRDEIAQPAFLRLARHCGHWKALAGAAPDTIEPLLQDVTFPERKAIALPRALQQIIDRRGALTLGFLAGWPVEAALSWLERLYGVGPKTSTATLNLSTLQKRVLTVDTAHCRAACCLGLVPEGTGLDRAVRLLNRQTPDAWDAAQMEEHHVLMAHQGKTFCAQAPAFSCPFSPLCASPGLPVPQAEKEKCLDDWLETRASRESRRLPAASQAGHDTALTAPP